MTPNRKLVFKIEVEGDENGHAIQGSKAGRITAPPTGKEKTEKEFENLHDALVSVTASIVNSYMELDKMFSMMPKGNA